MHAAGYKFVNRLISAAFEGKTNVVEPSYVYIKGDTAGGAAIKSEIGEDLEYFSVPVELGVRSFSSRPSCPALPRPSTPRPRDRRTDDLYPHNSPTELRRSTPSDPSPLTSPPSSRLPSPSSPAPSPVRRLSSLQPPSSTNETFLRAEGVAFIGAKL